MIYTIISNYIQLHTLHILRYSYVQLSSVRTVILKKSHFLPIRQDNRITEQFLTKNNANKSIISRLADKMKSGSVILFQDNRTITEDNRTLFILVGAFPGKPPQPTPGRRL